MYNLCLRHNEFSKKYFHGDGEFFIVGLNELKNIIIWNEIKNIIIWNEIIVTIKWQIKYKQKKVKVMTGLEPMLRWLKPLVLTTRRHNQYMISLI